MPSHCKMLQCGILLLQLLLLSTQIFAANLTILYAPATPTSINDTSNGPPPTRSNFTAQPLPPVPSPPIARYTLNYAALSAVPPSIPIPPSFLGISIELSVAADILGTQSDNLNSPFLNYLGAVASRIQGDGPLLRIGGNTQDTATYNTSSTTLQKLTPHAVDPKTGAPVTPVLQYNRNLLAVMASAASELGAKIIFGINMAQMDTRAASVQMSKDLASELGNNLTMLLVGNEPDRYAGIGARAAPYSIPTYLSEWGSLTTSILPSMRSNEGGKLFVAPSVCCAWTTQQVMRDNGMQAQFQDRLKAVSAIQYPQSLCQADTAALYGHAGYLNQSNIVAFTRYDEAAVADAVASGLPYYLVETNTASCIGVADVSNAFTSTLWALSSALQLAFRNHTGVLLHTSGRSTLYNLFTPPAFNGNTTSWITGPVLYALLVVAEALAPSTDGAVVRVLDAGAPDEHTAAYIVQEDGMPERLVAINMANDPSGRNEWVLNVPCTQGDAMVVKFLAAPGVAEKANIVRRIWEWSEQANADRQYLHAQTWAGQSFGYYSKGLLDANETLVPLSCPTNSPTASVSIPAPGAALVFLTPQSASRAHVVPTLFPPDDTDDPALVLGSNGSRGGGSAGGAGATSKGSSSSGASKAWEGTGGGVGVMGALTALVVTLTCCLL